VAGLSPGRSNEPGSYQVVVVGSGPGGLQTSYFLTRLGINHAVISSDDSPGGMFQRFPLFQRLISWTKPYSPAPKKTREFEWFDWNSLLSEEPESRSTVAEFMDGTSYFPSRAEMVEGIAAFAERTGIAVKYGCRWESTRAVGNSFILTTTAGEYECKVAVFAVGVTQAWKPDIPGLEHVAHYVDTKPREAYRGRSVFILGKRNSGLEVANALLPVSTRPLDRAPDICNPTKITSLGADTFF